MFFFSLPVVTKSSTQAYRAQNNDKGGFGYDSSKPPKDLGDLYAAIAQGGSFADQGPIERVWILSVCDMGMHADWNRDFTAVDTKDTERGGALLLRTAVLVDPGLRPERVDGQFRQRSFSSVRRS